VYPEGKRRVWLWSVGAGAALVLALIGLYFASVGSALSPGPVIAAHAPIEGNCALCHNVGRGVEDIRCERCHDSIGSTRLTNQAHVLYGSGDVRKADRAESVACIECHTDHRGREHLLRQADARQCGSCHAFSTLRRHPEFAAVTAAIQTGLGMKFPHERHMADVQRDLGTECAACHVPTADLAAFEPIDFDRHCAACHAPDGFITGKTGKMSEALLVLGDDVPPDSRQPGLLVEAGGPPGRRRVEVSGMVHRDPWVVYNATKLGREIDPEQERAEIATLQAQLAWLEQQRRESPLRALTSTQLDAIEASLVVQLGALEDRLVAVAADSDDSTALQRLAAGARTLAAELDGAGLAAAGSGLDPSGRSLVEALQDLQANLSAAGEAAPEPEAIAADRWERRKQELLGLLDAIAARGDESIQSRAADLRSAVENVGFDRAAGAADVGALRLQLESLDDALRTVNSLGDPQGRIGAAQVVSLRTLASQRIGGGLAPAEFASRRRELLDLLDAIERRSGEELALAVTQLRAAVLALRIGDSGDLDLRRRVAATRRLLERVQLERELLAQGGGGPGPRARQRPLALGSQRDLAAIDAAIVEIGGRLAELRSGPRGSVAVGGDERRLREATLNALHVACLKCHELPTTRLAPVRVAEPVMASSIFNHGPHVTQVDCSECHGDPSSEDPAVRRVYASKLATDVNVPGVAECAVCHNPSAVSDDCQTCHRYHPPSVGDLLGLR
jgi:hypothetical protein